MLDSDKEMTFEQAIALTQSLLSRIEAGELPPGEIEAAITELVKSENGARGFS
jgi:exonuclease VII small subunit